jgi:hypothetical protein
MDSLERVTYCGLYCDLCGSRACIPMRATSLKEAMVEAGWTFWGQSVPGFAAFWEFLEQLHRSGGCPGCRAGGGYPACRIRVCARERAVELCAECLDFPCEHIGALAARYPTLVADNRRLQTVGLARWLDEQRERARRGVVYADFRYEVDDDG